MGLLKYRPDSIFLVAICLIINIFVFFKILHFYNTPTNIAEDELIDIFNGALDGINVVRLKLFPKRGNYMKLHVCIVSLF